MERFWLVLKQENKQIKIKIKTSKADEYEKKADKQIAKAQDTNLVIWINFSQNISTFN